MSAAQAADEGRVLEKGGDGSGVGSTRETGTMSAAQAADEGRVLDELVSGGGDVVGRSLGDTAAKSAADFSKNPVGQAVDEVRVLKEVNGDGVTRLTRKQRQRLKRKMNGGS